MDPKVAEQEKMSRKGKWRESVQLLEGLQNSLKDALDQRHMALFSDDEEDDDWSDEEDEEDD
jgi:hypothetical protein